MSALTSPQFTLLVILLASSHCQTEEGITSHTPSPTTVHPPETGKYATQHRTSHKGTNQPDKTNKPPTYPPSLSRTNSRTQKSDGSCYQGDIVCEKDRLGYEAIATLHHQMDDDENGTLTLRKAQSSSGKSCSPSGLMIEVRSST
ncbi:hypothetical protein EB796_001038 [Bugula neritina]|uniref:STIM1/2 EF-hand domain-containing protein n=1 Tax=Bugula neritina TaxID=10212 RepID=A0A7J7KRA3_BUGNE|nr:hypothetical protein EB796_001038 [Bugula neritina]